MKSLNSVIHNISNKYSVNGMNIKKAFEVWKDEGLTSAQIKDQIEYDIKEAISLEDAELIYKAARNLEITNLEYELYNKLRQAKRIKLTPTIKSALEKVNSNTYRLKTAGIDISWGIEMRDGTPWLRRISNSQKTEVVENEDLKQSNLHTRVKQAAVEENEPWEVYYWNSGIADRFLEEYPGSLPEELRCIFKDLEALQQGAIRESDFLLRILDKAEEYKDVVKSLRDKADEEFNKRKQLRDSYEKGDRPEYYRGAAEQSLVRPSENDSYYDHDDELDLELLD